jgi:pilus assembly protein CpaF
MKLHSKKTYKSIEELIEAVSEEINKILRTNIYEISLSDKELNLLQEKKSELRIALRNCGIGDDSAKAFLKDIIKDILVEKMIITETNINEYIPFDSIEKLTSRDKFEILLYSYIKEHKKLAMENIIKDILKENSLEEDRGVYRSITSYTEKNRAEVTNVIAAKDIDNLYEKSSISLEYKDKLNILVQRIYAGYKGLGVVDDIRDQRIEGVSGGVSGGAGSYNSIWIFYKGKTIHLDFLSFESEKELERISLNIYRYGNPGQLSKAKGYIVNEMKDHSRVVVVRPPFAESFAFFVRKFDTIEQKNISELIKDKGCAIPIDIIKWLILGCRVCGITGSQGSGKTTLLMSLIGFIHPSYNLRIQELSFELNLRQVYPDRNILSFRETDYVSGQEGLDIQKKTDGSVNILGEVASGSVAAWMVQMSQTGSLFTLFTHHAKTTDNLIKYMRNSLLTCNIFQNERVALEQVTEAINFDIHLEKDINGHRYIERITEIIPTDNQMGYELRDIVKYVNGEYILNENLSLKSIIEMSRYFSDEMKEEFFEKYSIQI